MSALADPLSPAASAPGSPSLTGRRTIAVARVSPDAVVCAIVGLVLSGVTFGAGGGTQVGGSTYTEVALILAGAIAVAGALTSARTAGRLHGGAALAGLLALTALTALSITWSLAPEESWLETNRMLAYSATFAGTLAAVRLAPSRWPGVVGGVALGCVLVSTWALLTKVLPGTLSPDETFARLRAPFGYWNATGLVAAMGVPALLWLAVKRSGNLALNALAYPGLGLCLITVLLAYSRGALVALAVGLAVWFVLVPLRLRGVVALVGSSLVAGIVSAWAFSRNGLTSDDATLVERSAAGHQLGALLVAASAGLLIAGLVIGFTAANRPPTLRARRRAGIFLVTLVVLAPVAGLVTLATLPGGLDGQIAQGYDQLTNPKADTPSNTPGRLTATSSVRSRYWREALDIWRANPVAGAGAGSFAVARTRYRTGSLQVRQAHGYFAEVVASLGLVGLAVTLALFTAWLVPALRTTGLRRRDRGLPHDAERIGMLSLVSVVVVFGVHSLIDWTWLIPGTAVVGLVSAAWVAGRGPLRDRLEAPASVAARAVAVAPARPARLPRWLPAPRLGGAGLVVVVALASAWTALQPLRSVHAGNAAFAALDAKRPTAALAAAQRAVDLDPLSLDARFNLSALQGSAGRSLAGEATLERAVESQPASAEAWRRLAEYRAVELGKPREGLAPLRAAYYLDPESTDTRDAFLTLRRQLAAVAAPSD